MTTNGEDLTIEFKSPIRKLHDYIFLGSLAFIVLLVIAFFGLKLSFIHPLIVIVFGFSIYYFLLHKISCLTTIVFNDDNLIITQDSKLFNLTRVLSIPLKEIRGFEINQVTRGNKALFIYTTSFKCYKYSLIKSKDELLLNTYLNQHLKVLNNKANPLFKSFIQAYIFALKRTLVFILLCGITITLIYLTNNRHFDSWSAYKNILFALLVIIFVLLWWRFVQVPIKKNYFRFGAFYWFSNIFIYSSAFILIPITLKYSEMVEEPIHIKKSFQLLNQHEGKLFQIKETSYDPSSILVSSVTIHNIKGKQFRANHIYLTPLSYGDTIKSNGLYNIWMLKTYQQYLKKSLSTEEKEKLLSNFHNTYKIKLMANYQNKPIFYKLENKKEEVKNILSNSYNATNSSIIVEPHWEHIKDYKRENLKQLIYFILTIVIMNILGSLFIAINR